MRSPQRKIITLLISVVLLLGCVCLAQGQYTRSRRVRVYHPGTHNRTRVLMNRRALRRKIIRKHSRAARKHVMH